MNMGETGMAEGLARLDQTLGERAKRVAAAWAAAAVTVASDLLDLVEPEIPRRSGELAGSGFVERVDPVVYGWGSAHAEPVHELDRGRGFKFHQRVINGQQQSVPERQAALVDGYADAGTTPSTARSSWPETPVTSGAAAPLTRRRNIVRRGRR